MDRKENNIFLVSDYGVKANDPKDQTLGIQKCIDVCSEAGGGVIVITTGTYLISSIRLYSNITLKLESGAILLGSKNYKEYENFNVPTTIKYLYDDKYVKKWNLPEHYFYAMITAFEEENIKIIGEPGSIINGQDTFDPNGEEKFRGPMGIIMSQIKNLTLEGYIFENSANWSHTLDGCENVTIKNLAIKAGHDGFNFHHSKKIRVSDCHLETGDDCFAGYDVNDLLVEHCFLNTACNGARIGGSKIVFKDCTFQGPGHFPHLSENTYYTHAIFKYYALDSDPTKENSKGIKLIDCVIDNADKLITYDNGKEQLLQNDVPLNDFTLEKVKITGIRHTSLFRGNSEKGTLHLKDVIIDSEMNEPFLIIDASITLKLENVDFIKPVTIIQEGMSKIELTGKVTSTNLIAEK
ncbi:glycoside hydrolase family 28 [Enterococcus durans]|uniref:glycoside hydrolase family 28 protein n=1 Tax=Enterococcus durans TaxID=53345 RepID=UPI0011BE952C|nr:glycosyl hydrolase family 28 protein [Enterococcus durans]QED59087.1 glycoside hydrolase family 28 [Enterococcus durans]QED62998.1 glycoside hydrolase family 28 [Enterococcus durans]